MNGSTNLHWTDSMQESDSIREKRRHQRFYLNLPVEFRAMIVNASKKGLLIQSPNPVSSAPKIMR